MLNAPLVAQRLGYPELSGLDLLELFAFVHPARFAVPTPKGLAHALGLEAPESDAEAAPFLRRAAETLLARMGGEWPEREGAWASAQSLYRLRWPWSPVVAERLRRPERDERWLFSRLPNGRKAPAERRPGRSGSRLRMQSIGLQALPDRMQSRARAARLCGRCVERLRAAPVRGAAEPPAGRGRHRHTARRSAIWLRPRSGHRRLTEPCGFRPTRRRFSGSSIMKAAESFPMKPSGSRRWSCARGGRITSAC
jgi:ATP-dependent DNA helicase DinG